MAIELPARRHHDLAAPAAFAVAGYAPAPLGRPLARPLAGGGAWPHAFRRALEILPGALALCLISTLVWGYVWFPAELAVGLLLFDVYWLWKSWTIAYHVIKGVRLMRRYEGTIWRDEYRRVAVRDPLVLPWEAVKHVVVIPNYSESEEKLRATLRAMAQANDARENIIPVLAMEEADADAYQKAAALAREFASSFFDLLVSFHPAGLPGEVRPRAGEAREAVFVLGQFEAGGLQSGQPVPQPGLRVDLRPDRQGVDEQTDRRLAAGQVGRAAGDGGPEDHVGGAHSLGSGGVAGQQQRPGVVCNGLGEGSGGDRDHDTPGRGRGQIHRIHPDAPAGHDTQARRRGEDARGDRLGASDDGVDVADQP